MTMKTKRRLKSLLKYLVLACFLVLTMFPFVWMLLTSLKGSQGEIYAFPVRYLPNPASAVNYVAMLWKGCGYGISGRFPVGMQSGAGR